VITEGDERAPDHAIAAALGGQAAHHTATTRDDTGLRLRILFATAPDRVDEIRDRIDAALAAGHFTGPDGRSAGWQAVSSGCARIVPEDRPQARQLLK
jgi:hypothetical protein